MFLFDYDKLERLIRESGKTKSHLCRAMGKPVYYLRDAIGQKTAIPDELQAILADELGVTVEYLNGLTDQKEKSPASEDVGLDEELIRRLCMLTPEEVQRVDAFVQGILASR